MNLDVIKNNNNHTFFSHKLLVCKFTLVKNHLKMHNASELTNDVLKYIR